MTAELKKAYNIFGDATGQTRYDQTRELARAGGLPLEDLGKRGTAINEETIKAFQDLSEKEWRIIYNKYREEATSKMVISNLGLEQIRHVIKNFETEPR